MDSVSTPVRSPTKTLRFDRDVLTKESEKSEERKRRSNSRQSLTNSAGAEAEDDEDEWFSDCDDAEVSRNASDTLIGPATPISALPSHLLPQTPSAYCFSPATPSVRTHGSYEEDELTDCDADFSIYDEDASFAFVREEKQQQSSSFEGIEADPAGQTDKAIAEAEPPHAEDEEEEDVEREPNVDVQGTSGVERAETATPHEFPEVGSEETADGVNSAKVSDTDDGLTAAEEVLPSEGTQSSTEGSDGVSTINEVQSGRREAAAAEGMERHAEVRVEEDIPTAEPDLEDSQRRPNTPEGSFVAIDSLPSPFLDNSGESSEPTTAPCLTSTPSAIAVDIVTPLKGSYTRVVASSPDLARPSAQSHATRLVQSQVHDAPTARRQLTKLSSLASKRSFDSLQDPNRRPALTAMVPGSSNAGSRKVLTSTRTAMSTPSTSLPGIPRPPPVPSRLAPPASVRSRTGSESTGSQLSTVAENQAPSSSSNVKSKSTNLSSSLPPSTTMKPPTSTIPRPRTLLARPGLKPPSAPIPSAARTVHPPQVSSRTIPAAKLQQRPVSSSLSRSVPPPRSARPDITLPSPASRQLPALQQTTSAPSVLASNRGPTPSLQSLPTNHGPPVARSARPVNLARPSPLPSTISMPSGPSMAHPVRASSPQKRNPVIPVPLDTRPPAVGTEPIRSAEIPVMGLSSEALPPSLPAPSLPPPLHLTSSSSVSVFASPPPATIRSPPRRTAPASPLRSPRRVPVNQAPPPAFPSTSQQATTSTARPNSALVLPAEKLAVAAPLSNPVDVFGVQPVAPVPVRSSRIRTTKTAEQNPAPLPVKRVTRRTAAAAASSTESLPFPSAPPLPPKSNAPLIPRSSRRPQKPSPVPTDAVEEPPANTVERAPASVHPTSPPRPSLRLFHSNPAPVLTQEELNRLTQRNTKKNQKNFNKIEIETVFLDENRPPSPTSKIRKSFGQGPDKEADREASKESREARAAKRRRALRSSTDGTELEALRAELGDGSDQGSRVGDPLEPAAIEPMLHFRAPGDEEQFSSPARPAKKSGAKKKTSTATTTKHVRWDKALVYEGPKGDTLGEAVSGIIKTISLDKWGNSTETLTNYAKPSPVVIRKRVFKDDEQ
ncbi:hypothetical protein JCM11491_004945 [Sporobolomyces phaffii]